MINKLFLLTIILLLFQEFSFPQVRIRLLSDYNPDYIIFKVAEGKYELTNGTGDTIYIIKGEPVILSRVNGKIGLKARGANGLVCDSVLFKGMTGNDIFSLRAYGTVSLEKAYSGDLQCYPDLGTLVCINNCNIEKYISGVVKAEGGNGKNEEYFKTQAVIARTYTYKYFNKHIVDRYNLCDNTHCQVFNGVTTDSIIIKAVLNTKGLVIIAPDSSMIISAFHSNCGGETSPSEFVWLDEQPYFKRVVDPFCLKSKNATWEKIINIREWAECLKKNGYTGSYKDPSVFNFTQSSRMSDYRTGSFTLPLRLIRSDLDLRSSFFSVSAEGDSLLIKGRGYGHGVGLCQEGAIAMALKGFNFKEIIDFYYYGVIITDIKNAKMAGNDK